MKMTKPTLTTGISIAQAERGHGRLIGYDLIRAVAILLVMVDHLSPRIPEGMQPSDSFFLLTKWLPASDAVLFFMLSGALLLPVGGSWRNFYSGRLKRIALPLVIWSVAYALINRWYYDWSADFMFHQIKWLWFTPTFSPGWFLFTLAGIYLAMPVFSPWIQKATRRQLELVIAIWLVAGVLPWLGYLDPGLPANRSIAGVFANFFGYALVGYYLSRYPLRLCSASGAAIVICGVVLPLVVFFIPNNAPVNAYLTDNMSISVMAGGCIWFAAMLRCSKTPRWVAAVIRFISRNAFGVYLIHTAVAMMLTRMIDSSISYTLLCLPVVTGISLLLSETIRRIPYLNRIL